MPIFEFKCTECEEFFEVLVMKNSSDEEIKCTKCKSQEFERVLSTTNFSVSSSSSGRNKQQGANVQERSCSGGSCSTYTLPGQD